MSTSPFSHLAHLLCGSVDLAITSEFEQLQKLYFQPTKRNKFVKQDAEIYNFIVFFSGGTVV